MIHSLHRCVEHQISKNIEEILVVEDQTDIEYVIESQTVSIVVHSSIQAIVTLLWNQNISTTIQLHCFDNATITLRLIVLFPEQIDILLNSFVCGNYAQVTLLVMCVLSQQQKVLIQTRQIHCGHHGTSKLVLQGLLTGSARLKYEGTIRIEPTGYQTYASQHNKNILLSSTSQAISIPNIEVLHHDVQCYHGAAVGKFDSEQMLYMQSRGFDSKKIQQLLVQAFLQEPLQGYKNRDAILKSVYEKI